MAILVDVIAKVDIAIETINDSKEAQKLRELKKLMDMDKDIQTMLNDFVVAKVKYQSGSISSKELAHIKERLYMHPLMIQYRQIYSNLNLIVMHFTKELSSLINTKDKCQRGAI